MANKVYIDVIVDDKGTTQRVAVSAKKLGAALNEAGVGAATADRMIKGVGQQSSNTTKNFSKMAQGLSGSGGLVQAYAILAAQIFAVSAAFNFLKSAGTLENLKQGQLAYAAGTGVALRTLTNDLIEATGAQVDFQTASQSAAIGVASGLSPDQLSRLGKAAKDASFVLGRDVTDSLNRLVRGVTKAEPELLDELGIILRLDTAAENYGRTINKLPSQLTPFEKSQAVANEVLTQAEEKFGRIAEITGNTGNQFAKLGVVFDNILNKVKEVVIVLAGPIAKVFTETPAAGIAFFGIFAKSILTQMIPAFGKMGEAAEASKIKQLRAYATARKELKALEVQAVKTNAQLKAEKAAEMQSQMGGMTFRAGGAFDLVQQGKGDTLSNRQLAGMKVALNRTEGAFATMTAGVKAKWLAMIEQMMLANKNLEGSSGITAEKIGSRWQILTTKMKLLWSGAMASMSNAAVAAGEAINKAFFWLMIISTIYTLGKIVWDKFFPAKPLSDAEKAAEKLKGRMESLTEEFAGFAEIQNILGENTERSTQYLAAFGQKLGSLGIEEAKMALESLTQSQEAYNASLAKGPGFLTTFFGGAFMGMTPQDTRDEFVSTFNFEKYIEKSGTGPQKASLAYFKNEVEAFEKSTDARAKGSKAFSAYINLVAEYLKTGKQELIPEILKEKSAVAEITQTYAQLQNQQKENTNTVKDLFNKYLPATEYDRAIDLLNQEATAIDAVKNDLGDLTDAEQKRLDTIRLQKVALLELANAEHEYALQKEKNKAADILAMQGLTNNQKELLQTSNQLRDNELERAELLRKRREIEFQMAQKKGENTEEGRRALENNQAQLDILMSQSAELKRQLDVRMQIFDAANQSLESGLQTNIAALIKGEEKSIKDAMLNIAKGMLNSVADVMAKNITNMIMGTSPLQVAMKQGQIIASSFISAGRVVAQQISTALIGRNVYAPHGTPSTIPGAIPGTIGTQLSNFTGRQGGVLNFIKNLIPMPFATGGVVTSPTLGLVGEGRYNEAVVPLPNGKAIPVQMNGAGNQNNVTVNVSVDNQGNASSNSMQDSQQAGNLGQVIARAVQQELQNQKRSGGILNPYGVA